MASFVLSQEVQNRKLERISHIVFKDGEFKIPTPKPLVETYFSIPQELELLENISVLDYLKQYVWLSSKRQKQCEEVFAMLMRFNLSNPTAVLKAVGGNGDNTEAGVKGGLSSQGEGGKGVGIRGSEGGSEGGSGSGGAASNNYNDILLPTVFLGVGLVDLFEFPATHHCMTELLKYLEHGKYRFREVDYRTWCGISAFAERMAFDIFFQYENLEKIDFEYLKKYGDWYDISPGLQSVFDLIHDNHIEFPGF